MPSLSRRLTLPLFTFYGLGSILGAGIYALVGKVAGEAGMFAPISFMIAAILAALTGFSYAELSSRYPKSGGEAVYAAKAFKMKNFSTLIGLMVVCSAIVSSGALMNAFFGYLEVFMPLNRELAITATALAASGIAIWGIKESAITTSIFTLIEIGGLLLIVWAGREALMLLPLRAYELVPPSNGTAWSGILTGAFIAFYASIGFEDMANVAEEVKDPHRNLPLGIILAIAVSTLLYCVVSLTAVLNLPIDELSSTGAPLALVYERATGSKPVIITFIGLFAVANGILVQIIIGSRILYGLSRRNQLPGVLGKVNPMTRTPIISTILVTAVILALALWFDLSRLAQTTSLIVLVIFAIVNLSCMAVKLREPEPEGVRTFPFAMPLLGFVSIVLFIAYRIGAFIGA